MLHEICNHKEKDKMQQKISEQMNKLTINFLFGFRRLLIFSRGEFLEQTSNGFAEF